MPIEAPLSRGRYQFTGDVTKREIKDLVSNKEIEVLQTSDVTDRKVYELLNDHFFSLRPDVQLRLYGFYKGKCDLSIAELLPSVERFSADCLMEAVNVDCVSKMRRLKDLSIGVFNIESFEFIAEVNPSLSSLALMASSSKKPRIDLINRFQSLETLYLEGQQKGINAISDLKQLKDITLRSISTDTLEFLEGLQEILSVDIKLGGIKKFESLTKLPKLRYLEIWQVRDLRNIDFVSRLEALQYLFLQSLPHIDKIPDLGKLKSLRRIYIENLKSLRDFSGIARAPILKEFCISLAMKQEVEDILPILDIAGLEKASAFFGSNKKNSTFKEIASGKGIQEFKHSSFVFE